MNANHAEIDFELDRRQKRILELQKLLDPSPCDQKFADGTPHPMACWQRAQDSGHARSFGHCLICDSEQKLRVECEFEWRGIVKRKVEIIDEIDAVLTALREGLAGVAEQLQDIGEALHTTNAFRGREILSIARELTECITPPPASGRETL